MKEADVLNFSVSFVDTRSLIKATTEKYCLLRYNPVQSVKKLTGVSEEHIACIYSVEE
jgi:hypothetical protein